MVENDRLRLEVISESSGEVYSSRRINNVNRLQLSIPIERRFGKNRFVIDGASCSTMNFKLSGALSHLCHAYLHFDTLLLHKKDELNRYKRLELKDFESVLNLQEKATRRYLNELIDHQALIRPDNAYRYFVSPRFMIRRGGEISFEEFDMLFKQDPLIKGCLESDQLNQYKTWRTTKWIRTR
jgi:hypothetical protein